MVKASTVWVSGSNYSIPPGTCSGGKITDYDVHEDGYDYYVTDLSLAYPDFNNSDCNGSLSSSPDGEYLIFNTTQYCFFNVSNGEAVASDCSIPVSPVNITFSENYDTKFSGVGFTYASSTQTMTFDVGYYIDLTEIDSNYAQKNPTDIRIQYSLRPSTDIDSTIESIVPISNGNSTTTIAVDGMSDGTYDIFIGFYNLQSTFYEQDPPFKETNIQFSVTIEGGVITSFTPAEVYDGTEISVTPQYQCGITSIDGCVMKSVMWLFVPGDWGLSALDAVYAQLDSKFPFAYLTDFKDSITDVYTNPTTETLGITIAFASFGDVTLISNEMVEDFALANEIKALIAALMWIAFATQVWRRTQRIFSPQPV